jgi:predicted nucleic acid-binding protein
MVALPHHELWSDDVSITDDRWIAVERLVAAAQVTDAQLLGLPLRREGRLATFDRGVRAFVPSGSDPSKVLSVIG